MRLWGRVCLTLLNFSLIITTFVMDMSKCGPINLCSSCSWFLETTNFLCYKNWKVFIATSVQNQFWNNYFLHVLPQSSLSCPKLLLFVYRLTVLCPSCCSGSTSTWSCTTGELWWWDSMDSSWNCKTVECETFLCGNSDLEIPLGFSNGCYIRDNLALMSL